MQIYHMILLFRVHWQNVPGVSVIWETRVALIVSKGDVKESRDCKFSYIQIEEDREDRKLKKFFYTSGGQ